LEVSVLPWVVVVVVVVFATRVAAIVLRE